MGDWNIEPAKQGKNISLGYGRPLPEVFLDEKFQNMIDEILLNKKEFNPKGPKFLVTIEFIEKDNIIR